MHALLDARPDLDAVFAASDLMAAGALRALRERGRSVPGDVAVVGFGMGREMVRLLLARIAGEEPGSVVLDTYLIARESA